MAGLSIAPALALGQGTATGRLPLVGTWQLTAVERLGVSPTRVSNPVGILVQAANGYVIEIVSQAGRAASLDAAEQFATYQGRWGTFAVDGATASYHIEGDLDPRGTGRRFTRRFERTGTRLELTEMAPDGKPLMRTTWERIPELEALPAYQDAVVGFWQWTAAGLYTADGTNVQPAERDASVIVYTPSGHMAVVYLPPPGRPPFAGPAPTVEEARRAWQSSVSYFGTYIVQPTSRTVYHYQLGAANPAAVGGSFMRNFEIRGAEVTLRFPPVMRNGEQVWNTLTLKRLSGLADVWPTFRR